MTENIPNNRYLLPNGEVINPEDIHKHPHAYRGEIIDYLVKTGQISEEEKQKLLADHGPKTPEVYFEQ